MIRPQKTDQDNPKWYMVDVTFRARAKNFIPLSLIKHLASLSPSSSSPTDPPDEVEYIEKEGMKAIKGSFRHTNTYPSLIGLLLYRNGPHQPCSVKCSTS